MVFNRPREINEKIDKMHSCLGSWSARRLSLIGKITVIRSLVVSQIIHTLSPLPSNSQVIKELKDSLFDLLWNSKRDKIKRNVVIRDYINSGLKIIDIMSFKVSKL